MAFLFWFLVFLASLSFIALIWPETIDWRPPFHQDDLSMRRRIFPPTSAFATINCPLQGTPHVYLFSEDFTDSRQVNWVLSSEIWVCFPSCCIGSWRFAIATSDVIRQHNGFITPELLSPNFCYQFPCVLFKIGWYWIQFGLVTRCERWKKVRREGLALNSRMIVSIPWNRLMSVANQYSLLRCYLCVRALIAMRKNQFCGSNQASKWQVD